MNMRKKLRTDRYTGKRPCNTPGIPASYDREFLETIEEDVQRIGDQKTEGLINSLEKRLDLGANGKDNPLSHRVFYSVTVRMTCPMCGWGLAIRDLEGRAGVTLWERGACARCGHEHEMDLEGWEESSTIPGGQDPVHRIDQPNGHGLLIYWPLAENKPKFVACGEEADIAAFREMVERDKGKLHAAGYWRADNGDDVYTDLLTGETRPITSD